jgi:uncharacterized delta-60 repeat protein
MRAVSYLCLVFLSLIAPGTAVARTEPTPFRAGHQLPADTLSPQWSRLFGSTTTPSEDSPNGMATDPEGNTYVVGSGNALLTSWDLVLLKYDASGDMIWAQRWDGPESRNDFGYGVALDSSGNVYVTGISNDLPQRIQYRSFVIKYNSAGEQQWVASVEPGGDTTMTLKSVRVAGSGAVYAAGEYALSGYTLGLLIVRVNPDGSTGWVTRKQSPASYPYAWPPDVAIDDSESVCIAGRWNDADGLSNGVLLKYNAEGEELWCAVYGAADTSEEWFSDVALDGDGNIVAVGTCSHPGMTADYLVGKYSADGIAQWVRTYDTPLHGTDNATAVAVDDAGSIYVTGSSMGLNVPTDIVTIKFNAAGDSLWTVRYDSPDHQGDDPIGLTIDRWTNIFVSGTSMRTDWGTDYVVLRYDSSGSFDWSARSAGTPGSNIAAHAMATDPTGGIRLTGQLSSTDPWNEDIVVAAYDSSGNESWTRQYDGPGMGSELPTAMAVDADGNVAVTGGDFLTVALDPTGNVKWSDRYGGGSALGLASDAQGNFFVAGIHSGSAALSDFLTIKYSSTGERRWAVTFSRGATASDNARAIAVDSSGCVYVTGDSYAPNTNYDIYTVKYDSSGNQLWATGYSGFGARADVPAEIAVDPQGNVYVTGRTMTDTSPSHANFITLKYSPQGQVLWASTYAGPGNAQDLPADVAVGQDGSVYVTGRSNGVSPGWDYLTVKYNPWGAEVWATRYSHQDSTSDMATSIAVDRSGHVFVTGESDGSLATIRYAALTGAQEWVQRYGHSSSSVAALALSNAGGLYVTGSVWGTDWLEEVCLVAYDSTGTELWTSQHRQNGSGADNAVDLRIDARGDVYVAGSARMGGDMYLVLKYATGSTAVAGSPDQPLAFALGRNYPNPFNPVTTIAYSIPVRERVMLKVYDILGREVRTLADEEQQPGLYTVQFEASDISSGIYFYQLRAGSSVATEKMVVLK